MSSPFGSLGSCACISILFWDDHRGCVGHRVALWWKKRKMRPARHRRDAQRDHVEVAERAPGPGPPSALPFLSSLRLGVGGRSPLSSMGSCCAVKRLKVVCRKRKRNNEEHRKRWLSTRTDDVFGGSTQLHPPKLHPMLSRIHGYS